MKAILNPEKNQLEGTISLFRDEVKRKINGGVVESEKFNTEDERVQGLERWFGIRLTEDEKAGIRSLGSELRG